MAKPGHATCHPTLRAPQCGMTVTATASITLDDVRAAATRLLGELADTPCLPSRTLSAICGCEV